MNDIPVVWQCPECEKLNEDFANITAAPMCGHCGYYNLEPVCMGSCEFSLKPYDVPGRGCGGCYKFTTWDVVSNELHKKKVEFKRQQRIREYYEQRTEDDVRKRSINLSLIQISEPTRPERSS